MILAFVTSPLVIALIATSVSTFLNPPAADEMEVTSSTPMITRATQKKGPRK
jgi:hypothetical protein